jgi:folate-binding protein YgfZ
MSASFQARIPRDLVVVEGPDATSFLQSILSQDLDPVAVGAAVHALLLQPQGKLLIDLRAARIEPDVWWLVCEGGFGSSLAEGLNRFKIRVKADVRSEPVVALFVGGATASAPDGVVLLDVGWGVEVVGPEGAIAEVPGVPVVDADAYERARVEAGVPRQGFDVDERTIPQEAGLETDAVSFTKGCFIGQELVCRIDTRGHVNRLLRRVRAEAPLARGMAVEHDGKVVGEVTSAAGEVALVMIRREVEVGATVTVDDIAARVERL